MQHATVKAKFGENNINTSPNDFGLIVGRFGEDCLGHSEMA